jgi:hypothetical protein
MKKTLSKCEALTAWRAQRDKLGNGQKQASEGHSLSGECRGKYKSRYGEKASERGPLTNWRVQR